MLERRTAARRNAARAAAKRGKHPNREHETSNVSKQEQAQLGTRNSNAAPHNLSRASMIEMFFDLVFIFCLNQLIPVITEAPAGTVDLATFYTFIFTTVLLLQIWFDVTLFMNGFGTAGPLDVVFLIVNVFLLIIMAQAASAAWEHYLVYNTCWTLILANCCIHWLIRLKMIKNPDRQIAHIVKRTVGVMCAQIIVISVSDLFVGFAGQALCFVALALGFFSWSGRDAKRMNSHRYQHLADRSSLLMIMTFGETVIAAGTYTGAQEHVVSGLFNVLTILLMFLVYAIEINRALDITKLGSGLGFMAITTIQALIVTNYTAAFDLMVQGGKVWIMDASLYFSLSLTAFLLSFFVYIPFNKVGRTKGKRWIAARLAACLACLGVSTVFVKMASGALSLVGFADFAAGALNAIGGLAPLLANAYGAGHDFAPFISTCAGLILVLIVLVLDWRNYGERPRGMIEKLYGNFEGPRRV